MDASTLTTRMNELVAERARQDAELAEARRTLEGMGTRLVTVPQAALEAIDAACLVHLSPSTPALRG
jgi:hypothetical protein